MSQIVDHAHCEICQKVVSPGERTCSLECSEKLQEATKMKKRSAIILVVVVVGAIILTKLPSPF